MAVFFSLRSMLLCIFFLQSTVKGVPTNTTGGTTSAKADTTTTASGTTAAKADTTTTTTTTAKRCKMNSCDFDGSGTRTCDEIIAFTKGSQTCETLKKQGCDCTGCVCVYKADTTTTTSGTTAAKAATPKSSTYKEDGITCTKEHGECAGVAPCMDEDTGACNTKTGLFADTKSCPLAHLYACEACFPYSMCGVKGKHLRKVPSDMFQYNHNCQQAEHGCRLAARCFDEDQFCDAKTGLFKDPRCKVSQLKHCRACYKHSMCGSKGSSLRKDPPESFTYVEDGKNCVKAQRGCAEAAGCFNEYSKRCIARTGKFDPNFCDPRMQPQCASCFPHSVCGSKPLPAPKTTAAGKTTKAMTGSCGCEKKKEKFCNQDRGSSGKGTPTCEPCPDDNDCTRLGLPSKGADDCIKWCLPSEAAATTTTTAGPKTAPAKVAWSDTPKNLVEKFAGLGAAARSNSQIDGKWTATWAFNKAEKDKVPKIFLAVEAATTGWVGFAIAEAGGMRGADLVMAYVGKDGKAYAGDYHATGDWQPIKDGCQDWSILHGEERDGSTLVVLSRPLQTSDSNDRAISRSGFKKTGLLAAFGKTDVMTNYHGSDRAKFFVDMSSGKQVDWKTWTAAKRADKTLRAIDLKANEGADLKEPPRRDGNFRKPIKGGQILPSERTSYFDICFTMREEFKTGWITAFEGVQDGSPKNVHHVTLFAYDKDGCLSDSHKVSVWIGNANVFEDLPEGVGMAMSRFKSFRMELHYDNPENKVGLRDNSGVRLWVSTQKPKHEAGILEIGDPKLDTMGMHIDNGLSYWTFKCSPFETKKLLKHKITVFSSILHMHEGGEMMYTEVTDGTGKAKRVNRVEYFDFDHQDFTMLAPYEVNPGDELTTRCYFKNPKGKELRFGLSSGEEMCIDFLYYYPLVDDLRYCANEASSSDAFLTKTILPEGDFGKARDFGITPGSPDDKCEGSAVTKITAVKTAIEVSDSRVAALGVAGAALSFVVTAIMN